LSRRYSFKDLLNRKTLIIGEVGRGKTRLTAHLLKEAADAGYAEKITVIDMAPRTIIVGGLRVGGCLRDFTGDIEGVRFLEALSNAPRLTGKTREEVLRLVEKNINQIDSLLGSYLASPTQILFINDISIYLQSGELRLLTNVMRTASTFIANGYLGRRLASDHGAGVSERERKAMLNLKALVDRVISL